MQIIDIIIVVPFLWFAFKGLTNGLIKELFSTIALFVGIYIAIHFSSWVGKIIATMFSSNSPYFKLITFAVTFLLAILLMKLGSFAADKFFSKIGIGWLNKLGGLAFGLFKGILIVGAVIYFLNKFDSKNMLISSDTKEKSLLYKPLEHSVQVIFPSLSNLIKI
jgi:membrane protein required for colicin V production